MSNNNALTMAHKTLVLRDANGDGKISLSELEKFYSSDVTLQQYFSESELRAMAQEYFSALDQNKSGFIELAELT